MKRMNIKRLAAAILALVIAFIFLGINRSCL